VVVLIDVWLVFVLCMGLEVDEDYEWFEVLVEE